MRKQPTAMITGASRGLGFALAKELAQRDWILIIDGRDAQSLLEAKGALSQTTKVIAIPGDVSNEDHREALAQAAQELGGLDAMINNASVLGASPLPELLDYPLDRLAEVYQVNVLAPLGILQSVKDELKPGARIINITSDAGVEAYPGWGGYGSSKAALEHLSAVLATENPDLKVYWVDPGDMRTQMQQKAFPGENIQDRPLPETSVPGLTILLEGNLPSGRYLARQIELERPV
jgi:NAD(P)-dependent dehydrogenase (short-subunit alcohol dehydrogenase family)